MPTLVFVSIRSCKSQSFHSCTERLVVGNWIALVDSFPMRKNHFMAALLAPTPRSFNWRRSQKKIIPLLHLLRRKLYPSKVTAEVRRFSLMPLLKFLPVFTPRPPFNAMLLQPPPWLEVQPPLLQLPSPVRSLLLLIAVQPSRLCVARRRLLHPIHRQLPPRGNLAFV